MPPKKPKKIKPTLLAYEVRKAVSEILNKPVSERINHQIFRSDQKVLAFWAADCAEHVLVYFENECPNDNRPRKAIEECRAWANTGVFSMQVIRGASLSAHAAAKMAEKDDARFAAHAAGQAVATAHVATHALGSAVYGIRAVAAHSGMVDDGLVKERNWQLELLRKYAGQS
ncbi:MAG: putative immunity protein [Candidatus Bathyarchaeia archaeon]|jgi:hypothetical protein